MQEKIELTVFENALVALERDLEFAGIDQENGNHQRFLSSRSAAVHSFQLLYDVTKKLLRRVLQNLIDVEDEVRQSSYEELLRLAGKHGLLNADEVVAWIRFRALRNNAAQDYEEDVAANTYEALPEFLSHAQMLLQSPRQRVDI